MEKSFNTKLYIKEIFQCFMATTFVGIGVAMFISCKLGSDSLTVFLDGMNHSFGIPVSIVNQCAAVIILLLAIILNKKAIGINTVVSAISIGFCIEVGNLIITPFHIAEQTWIARFIFIFFAQVLLSIGYGWMQTFQHGMSYTDAMLYGIAERLKIKYMYIRTVFDFIFFLIGVSLGGVVGIGTIFSICTLGFFISVFKRKIENVLIKN